MSFRSVAGAVFVDVWILEECKVKARMLLQVPPHMQTCTNLPLIPAC